MNQAPDSGVPLENRQRNGKYFMGECWLYKDLGRLHEFGQLSQIFNGSNVWIHLTYFAKANVN